MYLFDHKAFGTLGLCEHPANEIGQGEAEVNKVFIFFNNTHFACAVS